MKKSLALLGALLLACGAPTAIVNAAPAPQAVAQATAIVTGTVTDAQGEPIIGASVTEIGTNRGTVTDVDGRYSLKVAPGAKLQISFIGYKTQTIKAQNDARVSLADDNALLDEIVVVGYGTQKRVNLTGAVTTVDVDKILTSRPEQDVTKALQGAVPGLSVINSSGNLDDSPSLTIRGVGTLSNSATSSPLIIVDGVPIEDLSMVNGDDIASISVLKDAA